MLKISLFGLLSLFSLFHLQAQDIGLQLSMDGASEGYTLFNPEKTNKAHLVNNCGESINEWTFTERPGITSYLLENGNLLQAGRTTMEIRDWDNNLVWLYDMDGNGLQQHHDIEPLPNGNILCVITDDYQEEQAAGFGRDTDTFSGNMKLDKIVELQPVGTEEAVIVWEWKFADHFIQDFDSTLENFGVVNDHPELLNVNFEAGFAPDWSHVNGIDYNAELDQIIISARHLSELLIIDHSTTTEEAAGHTGGNSNKGGDILWRWGNPQVYGQGQAASQKLDRQHDGKWVPAGYPDAGKISVFNNGGYQNAGGSSIHLIDPAWNGTDYQQTSDGQFLPLDYDWSWSGEILGEVMAQGKKSGVESLLNGNLLICETAGGRMTELTKEGELVWVYVNPRGVLIEQTPPLESMFQNDIFRAERYDLDYPAFDLVDTSPQAFLEETELSLLCTGALSSSLTVKVLLEGPYEGNGQMRASDFTAMPVEQPFSAAPYNYQGAESLNDLSMSSDEIVDWLLIEVRSGTPNIDGDRATETVVSKAVLLKQDGTVIESNGNNALQFEGLGNIVNGESYYLCIRHRNHLDVLTAEPFIAGALVEIDLKQDAQAAFGLDQLTNTSDSFSAMRSGELNQDGAIELQDYEQWKLRRATLNAYQQEDANLDNCIQVTDFDLWFLNQGMVGTPEIDFE